jgi:hypothetical protein
LTQVAEQSKHTEPIKNHFTTFTLLAFSSLLKEIHGEDPILWPERASSTQKPGQERQDDADEYAGCYRKVEFEIAALVGNIARQPPQPAQAASRPKPPARHGDKQPDHEKKLPDILHRTCPKLAEGALRRNPSGRKSWLIL